VAAPARRIGGKIGLRAPLRRWVLIRTLGTGTWAGSQISGSGLSKTFAAQLFVSSTGSGQKASKTGAYMLNVCGASFQGAAPWNPKNSSGFVECYCAMDCSWPDNIFRHVHGLVGVVTVPSTA
jgi:hypothetical protein